MITKQQADEVKAALCSPLAILWGENSAIDSLVEPKKPEPKPEHWNGEPYVGEIRRTDNDELDGHTLVYTGEKGDVSGNPWRWFLSQKGFAQHGWSPNPGPHWLLRLVPKKPTGPRVTVLTFDRNGKQGRYSFIGEPDWKRIEREMEADGLLAVVVKGATIYSGSMTNMLLFSKKINLSGYVYPELHSVMGTHIDSSGLRNTIQSIKAAITAYNAAHAKPEHYDGEPCKLPIHAFDTKKAKGFRFEYAGSEKRNIKPSEWFHGWGAFGETIVFNDQGVGTHYYPLRAIKIEAKPLHVAGESFNEDYEYTGEERVPIPPEPFRSHIGLLISTNVAGSDMVINNGKRWILRRKMTKPDPCEVPVSPVYKDKAKGLRFEYVYTQKGKQVIRPAKKGEWFVGELSHTIQYADSDFDELWNHYILKAIPVESTPDLPANFEKWTPKNQRQYLDAKGIK